MPSFNRALSQADVIFLFGARLNWILHFGRPPRFRADVKIVQVCANRFSFIALLTFLYYVNSRRNIDSEKSEPEMGFEPMTLRDLVGCSNH